MPDGRVTDATNQRRQIMQLDAEYGNSKLSENRWLVLSWQMGL